MTSFGTWVKNIFLLLVFLFSGGTLLLIIDGVATGSELTPFNTAVEDAMVHVRTPILTQVFLFVTNIGSPFVLVSLSLVLAIYLLLHKDTYDALLYLSSIMLALVAFILLKNAFQIPRPTGGLVSLDSWSFPSGHASVATAFFFSTGYAFWSRIRLWPLRIPFALACAAAACLISFSRVYLGAHYALDVLAGTALGLSAVSVTILAFNIFLREESWRRGRRSARI
jgi:undecaprenyl-diphosphatase